MSCFISIDGIKRFLWDTWCDKECNAIWYQESLLWSMYLSIYYYFPCLVPSYAHLYYIFCLLTEIFELKLLSSKQRSYIQIQTKMILKLKRNFRKSRKHMRLGYFVSWFGQELVNKYDVNMTKFTIYDFLWQVLKDEDKRAQYDQVSNLLVLVIKAIFFAYEGIECIYLVVVMIILPKMKIWLQ